MTLDKLKAELNARMEQRKVELEAKVAELKVLNELKKLESPLYEKRQLEKQDNLQLETYIEQLEEMYSVDNRRINRVFGYGVMVDKILTIVRSIQYLKLEEKQDMIMMTGLDEATIEEVLDALGNPAYFSVRELRIIDEQPADVGRLRELLKVVASDMGLVSQLNLGKVTTDNFNYQFTRARIKAEEALENTVKYSSEEVTYSE